MNTHFNRMTFNVIAGMVGLLLAGTAAAAPAASAPPTAPRSVVVNGQRISEEQIQTLEKVYRTRVANGNFWYDRYCGAWGLVGGPTLGFMHAGMNLGGPLRADASNGNTGIFINGRQLHSIDVAALRMIYPDLRQGRGWLDANGTWGFEGGPPIDNVWAAAARKWGNSGGGGGSRRPGILSGYDKTGLQVFGY